MSRGRRASERYSFRVGLRVATAMIHTLYDALVRIYPNEAVLPFVPKLL